MGGVGRREDLLDFFGAGEVGQDRGAFDRGAAFEVEARGPGLWGREVCGGVAGAEVEGGDFVGGVGGVGGGVDEGAGGVGNGDVRLREGRGEGEAEGGD